MVGETAPAKPLVQYQLHVKCGAGLIVRGHVKLVRAASSHHSARLQSTREQKDNKSINAHKTIVFYSCNRSTHRHGSDTTVGFAAWKTKKF